MSMNPLTVAKALDAGRRVFMVGGRRAGKARFAMKVQINLAKIARFRKGRPV
jgi:hypothetical protein